MSPYEFVDLNNDEEIQDSTREQSIIANGKPNNSQKTDTTSLDNYWLNEIKSQEDTARLITTVCILLLVASFTIVTNNVDRILLLLNNTRPYVPGTYSYEAASHIIPSNYLIFFEKFGFFLTIIGIGGFFFIWVFALCAARKALELELIASNDKLFDVAVDKRIYCNNAINIIIFSMVLLSIFVIGFMMATLPGWLQLGSIITFTAVFVILLSCASLFTLYLQRFPGIR